MVGWLNAFTEAERVGFLALIGTALTASASITAAFLSHRVRKENTEQHDVSQQKLDQLSGKIDDHGYKIDGMAGDLRHITARVDHAHERIDRRWG